MDLVPQVEENLQCHAEFISASIEILKRVQNDNVIIQNQSFKSEIRNALLVFLVFLVYLVCLVYLVSLVLISNSEIRNDVTPLSYVKT